MRQYLLALLIFFTLSNQSNAVDIDVVPAINTSVSNNKVLYGEVTVYGDFLIENLYIGFMGTYGSHVLQSNSLIKQFNNLNNIKKSVSLDSLGLGLSLKYDYYFYNNTNLYFRGFILAKSKEREYYKTLSTEKFVDYDLLNSVHLKVASLYDLGAEIGFAYGNLGIAVNYQYSVFSNVFSSYQGAVNIADNADSTVIPNDLSKLVNKKYYTSNIGLKLFYLFNYSTNKKEK